MVFVVRIWDLLEIYLNYMNIIKIYIDYLKYAY